MDSLIRWKKGDYIKLGQAVAKFNNTINQLEANENLVETLPDKRNYQELKEQINSRKELNRVIKALRRADIENLSDIHVYESGEEVSKWEFQEINKARRRAIRNLSRERETILTERPSIGMGDERLNEIQAIEKSFSNVSTRTGSDFKRIIDRIFKIGKSDYKITRDKQFQENFYKALEGISNFQNYEVLKNQLDKIKNPSKFYEYVKRSPVLMDLFLWYKESDSLFYGGFDDNEDAFDSTLMFHLGIEDVNV